MNQSIFYEREETREPSLSPCTVSESDYQLAKPDVDGESLKLHIGTRVALLLLTLRSQIKIFHWQTARYSTHKALDLLSKSLTDKNDIWIETFQGKYGRIAFERGLEQLTLVDTSSVPIETYISQQAEALLEYKNESFSSPRDADLGNIFEEILVLLWQAIYRLSLK